jgi:hypothetical protein
MYAELKSFGSVMPKPLLMPVTLPSRASTCPSQSTFQQPAE